MQEKEHPYTTNLRGPPPICREKTDLSQQLLKKQE